MVELTQESFPVMMGLFARVVVTRVDAPGGQRFPQRSLPAFYLRSPMPDVDQLLSEMAGMSDADLRRVRDASIALLGNEDRGSASGELGHAWKLIQRVCPNFPSWTSVRNRAAIKRQSSALSNLMTKARDCSPTRRVEDVDMVALGMIRCVVSYLRQCNRPVTPNTMLSGIANLGDAVESQFPGYAESKILGRVFVDKKNRHLRLRS